MNRRTRNDLSPMKGLLSRQLASITATLAKASQRRDAEVRGHSVGSRAKLEQLQKNTEDALRDMRSTMETATVTGSQYPQVSLREGYESDGEVDPKKLLAELDRMQQFNTGVINEDDKSDDPRRMLAELGRGASPSIHATLDQGPRKMLADLDRQARLSGRESFKESDETLEALHSRLTNMLSPLRDRASRSSILGDTHISSKSEARHDRAHDETFTALDKRSISYAVALQLETVDCRWEDAMGWTTYLFSSGFDGYLALQHKDAIVEQATKELEDIIQSTLKDEKHYREIEDKERLPCRLIVSNIAADAGEEELWLFFYQYKFDVRDVIFLDERDPIRRTRVAHIDMWTRKAAMRASYTVGNIFGLSLHIKLAVEEPN